MNLVATAKPFLATVLGVIAPVCVLAQTVPPTGGARPFAAPSPIRWQVAVEGRGGAGGRSVHVYRGALQVVGPRSGAARPMLDVTCRDGRLRVAMFLGEPIVGSEMTLRFGHGPVDVVHPDPVDSARFWGYLDGGTSETARALVSQMRRARRLQAEFTPMLMGPVTLQFVLDGFDATLPRVQDAGCRIPETIASGVVPGIADTLVFPVDTQTFYSVQVSRPAEPLPDDPKPQYPPLLRSAKLDAEVWAEFIVDARGVVDTTSFRVLKSTHALFTAAVRAVLPRLRFRAAEINGYPVRAWVRMEFPFTP